MSEVRLIDANALKLMKVAECAGHTIEYAAGWKRCVEYCKNDAPTVDAVPVRCKDCKYCYAEGFVNVRNVCEKHYDFGNVDDDWFCADGERRSE